MSKLPFNSVKYTIEGEVITSKKVSEQDIIGSLYSQSEGLLDEELELANLYKFGKIGRIKVIFSKKGKNFISIFSIPTNLSKMDVALVGAACESVDKVGNTQASIKIIKIEDNQKLKRKQVIHRAEELFKSIKGSFDSTLNIKEKIQNKILSKNVVEYIQGEVFGGEDVLESEEIILVEGRSDVVTLLKANYSNVLSFDGSKLHQGALDLAKGKKIILFLDGDKSGLEFSKELQKKLEVSSIAFAPKGREVSELSLPEIEKALKNKKELTSLEKRANKEVESSIELIKKNYFTKKEFDKAQEAIELVKDKSEFVVLGRYLKETQQGDVSSILSTELKKGKMLIFDGIYETSMNKKLKDSTYEVILCRRKSNLKQFSKHVLSFTEFDKLSE